MVLREIGYTMDGQPTLDLGLELLDELPRSFLEDMPPPPAEPEVWPDPSPPTDWLGLQDLAPGEVTRIYEGGPGGPALPPSIRYKRKLMRWEPERPLAEIQVQCRQRVRPLALWSEAPCAKTSVVRFVPSAKGIIRH